MPTENRSSNTEMVSVPREHELKIRPKPLADLLSGLKTGEVRDCSDHDFAPGDAVFLREVDDAREYTGRTARRTITHVQKHFGLPENLCVLSYAQPAQQHQGDPVAWRTKFTGEWVYAERPHTFDEPGLHLSESALLDHWEPVYTHADPAEVERLRERGDVNADRANRLATESNALIAQLAERDALLRAVPAMPTSVDRRPYDDADPSGYLEGDGDWCDNNRATVVWLIENHAAIRAALSASAEPSAPAETSQLLQELEDLYVCGEAPSADVEDDHERYLDDNATTARFLLLNLDRIRAALALKQ